MIMNRKLTNLKTIKKWKVKKKKKMLKEEGREDNLRQYLGNNKIGIKEKIMDVIKEIKRESI